MADVDIAAVVDTVALSESVGVHPDKQISVAEVVSLEEYKSTLPYTDISVNDAITLTENVGQKKGIALLPGRSIITLQSIGEVDWLWTQSFPGNRAGLKVHAIVVMAAGAETFVLRDGTTKGPVWFSLTTTGAYTNVYTFGGILLRPVMAIADQTGIDAASKYAILFDKP